MRENALIKVSKEFAVDTIKLCANIKRRSGNVLNEQLLRAWTSVGANIHEGNYASSRADFICKFRIALKECYETEYWLDIFKETSLITEDEYIEHQTKCSKIRIMLASSIKTASAKGTTN